MDKPAFADVDANVAEGASERVEKNQIAGLKLGFVDTLRGSSLLFGAAWQQQPDALLVHGHDKAAAVETAFGVVATAPVGHTQKPHRADDQLRGLAAYVLANLLDLVFQTPFGEHLVKFVSPGGASRQQARGKQQGGQRQGGQGTQHGRRIRESATARQADAVLTRSG